MSHINYLPADKHTTGDTGYIVDDYPYGFNQRTKIRFWVETNPKHGQRLCSQTLNPKTQKWNTVKCGVYKSVVRLYVNEINGHIGKSEYREYSLVDYDIAISLGVFE